MNGRTIYNKIVEWAKNNQISIEELNKLSAEELMENLKEDKY